MKQETIIPTNIFSDKSYTDKVLPGIYSLVEWTFIFSHLGMEMLLVCGLVEGWGPSFRKPQQICFLYACLYTCKNGNNKAEVNEIILATAENKQQWW